MIASTSSGRLFAGLGRYLASGRRGEERERIAWAASRNLCTSDPVRAARIMQAEARASVNVAKPVYHVALSFDPHDPVTPALMRRTADRLLEDLGLAEHQAVMVAHADRAHPHVHLMVNRVHPVTGRAWDRAYDYRRIEASLRALEVELGVRVVQGRHAPVPARDGPAVDDGTAARSDVGARRGGAEPDVPRSRGEVRAAARTGEPALVDRARAALPSLRLAAGWADVHGALAAHGLDLARRGQGFVVTDGRTRVKASRVARELSLRALEVRFGAAYDPWRASPDGIAAVAGARAGERSAGVPRAARAPQPPAQEETAMGTSLAPMPDTDARRPDLGRPDGTITPTGVSLGELVDVGRAVLRADRQLADAARVNPEFAAAVGELPRRAQFVAARLEQYEAVLRATIEAYDARALLRDAQTVAADGRAAGRQAVAAEASLRDGLKALYVSPDAARQMIERAVDADGVARTVATLRSSPELFGQLRAVRAREVSRGTDGPAPLAEPVRGYANTVATLAERALDARARSPNADQVRALVQAVDRAEAQVIRAEAVVQTMPDADRLARSAARGVARLDDRQFAELAAALPDPRSEMAVVLRSATVQALAERSTTRAQQLVERLGEALNVDAVPRVGRPNAAAAAQLHAAVGDAVEAGVARTVPATAAVRVLARDLGALERATPRERHAAGDVAGRALQQAVTQLTPRELEAVVRTVRLATQAVSDPTAALQTAVRAGVKALLAPREVER